MTTSPADGAEPARGAVSATTDKLVRHGSIYVVARVATLGAPYLLLSLFAKLLGDAGLGTIELLASAALFLTQLLQQGLPAAWLRLWFDQKSEPERQSFEATLTWYLLGSSLVATLLLALGGPALSAWLLPGIPFYPLGMLAVVAAAASNFALLCERKLQTEQRAVAFAVFALVRVAVSLGAVALLVLGLGRGVTGKLEADALGGVLLALLALAVIRPASPLKVNGQLLRTSLSYGLPLVLHALAALGGGLVSRLLLNGMLGVAAVGVFSLGSRLAMAGNVIATSLNQAYAPHYVQTLNDANQQEGERALELRRGLAQSALLSVVLVAGASLGLSAYGRELIRLLATAEFDASWRVLTVLNAASVAYACYLPFSQALLHSHAGTRLLPWLTLASALTQVAATLVLVPALGFVGAAWAQLAASALLAASTCIVGQKLVALPLDRRRWVLVLAVTASALLALAMVDARTDTLLLRLALKTALLLAALGTLLTCAGGLDKVRRLLRKRRA
jgi:O-antigen/teichoic acid export membrane protein